MFQTHKIQDLTQQETQGRLQQIFLSHPTHVEIYRGCKDKIFNLLNFAVYRMEYDKTGWSCSWNSDCTQTIPAGLGVVG